MQTSNIKVAVRVRPILPTESQRGINLSDKLQVIDNTQIRINSNTQHNTMKQYKFDQVFDEVCDQETIFKRVRMDYLVRQVVKGFHATVFVYG